MIGEQHYYEAKVFLSSYKDALSTLEYVFVDAVKLQKLERMLINTMLSRSIWWVVVKIVRYWSDI